jgi:hypothetical protein
MAYLRSRNDKMDAKYEVVATEYMRHGEAFGLRWDYAFFQMLLETGYLKYTGDVKAEQNNFAGLGATGGGARGESFKDVSTGIRAHVEHLLMYSGEKVENPTAKRTRDVQDWGVLTAWQQGIKGPVTFAQLAKQWAPGTKAYAGDIQTIAQRFFDGPCKGEDPQPELVAEARRQTATVQTAATEQPQAPAASPVTDKNSDFARRAVDAARADGTPNRAGLGATALNTAGDAGATAPPAAKVTSTTAAATAAPVQPAAPTTEAAASPTVKILNPAAAPATTEKAATDSAPAKATPAKAETAAKAAAVKTETPAKAPAAKEEAPAKAIETASVAGAAKDAAKVEKKAAAKCRVWTASYGGAKAIIIKATADQTTNYTVLDVNEGAEKREADAYISAYAKGGESVGEFATQTQALDKAFELCPEG